VKQGIKFLYLVRMKMKYIIVFFVCITSFVLSADITIAVAANVSYAIAPLKKAFEEVYPKTNVKVIHGSSGKLTAQISHGAPYDLFLSANMKYPQHLYEANLTLGEPVVYAQGALAILSNQARDLKKGLALFTDASIKKIAIANPKTAPYGVAAKEALEHAKLYTLLQEKFVYGESISQTVIYATSAADVGIIAKSSLYAPQMSHYKEDTQWVDVNASLYTPIDQGMVILNRAKEKPEAKAFYDFMLGKSAKEILTSYGYKVP